jgi:hypothetical protein
MGNTNAAVSQETSDSAFSYLTDIARQFGESYETRFVRMLTKFKLRDEEKGTIDLPNKIKKSNLFENLCFLRGWRAILYNIGDYKFEERNTDDTFWEECDTLNISSWWKFCDLWNHYLPHVRIRSPCYDTCVESTIFKNAFRYREQNNQQHKICHGESSSESDDDESQSDDFEVVELATVNTAESFFSGDCAQEEAIIEASSFHVEQANVMRELAEKHAQEAKYDIDNGALHPEKHYCIVCDYAQNLGIPHFGKEHHGETYYYSPLTINLFGVLDLSRSPNKLDCYVYREFTGKKGSNNVASLLMYNSHHRGMLQRYSPAERLTIIICGGQNKNNHVPRLTAYLVEMKYFRNVEFVSYVWGHTTNACDRLFNQMKIRFHKDQMHSYHMTLKILISQPNVSIIDATQEMFKYCGKMFGSFYSNFEPGTIIINHIFKVDMIDDTALEMQCVTHDGSSVVRQSIIKQGATLGQERLDLLKSYPLETLKPPGLRAITQVELYKKWRHYVDPQ